jgi:hypothetical protein
MMIQVLAECPFVVGPAQDSQKTRRSSSSPSQNENFGYILSGNVASGFE